MSGVGDSHHSRSPQLQALLDEIAAAAPGLEDATPGVLAPIAEPAPVAAAALAHDDAPLLTAGTRFDGESCDTIELAVYDPQHDRPTVATVLKGSQRGRTRWAIALAGGIAAVIVAIAVGTSSRATPAPAERHQPPVGFVMTVPTTVADGLTPQARVPIRLKPMSVISITTGSRTRTVAGRTGAAGSTRATPQPPIGGRTPTVVPVAAVATGVPVAAGATGVPMTTVVVPGASGTSPTAEPIGTSGTSLAIGTAGGVLAPATVDQGSTSADRGNSPSSTTPGSGQLGTSSSSPAAASAGTSTSATVESATPGCGALIQSPIPAAGGLLPPVLTMPCP